MPEPKKRIETDSQMMDYVLNGDGEELALLHAQLEHMGGVLEREIELHDRTRAENERLRLALKAIQDGTVKGTVGGEDVVWFDEITTLYDFCDQVLAYKR